MASFLYQLAFAFCLVQASRSQFVFELWLEDIIDIRNCYDSLELIHPECETYLSKFCLRAGGTTAANTRSHDVHDCSLGRVGRFGPYSALPIVKPINSTSPWTENFQLYVTAKDKDDGIPDDDRDDVFIDMSLGVSNSYTALMDFTGDSNNVRLIMKFRVMCHDKYYGRNCTIFCEAQDDDVNGHYSCDRDGSVVCLEGYENPENLCKDVTVINPCASTPCANNGSCTSTSPFDYTCQCLPGYTGSKCETKIIQEMSLASPGSSSGTTTTIALLGTLCVLAFLVSAILLVCLVILRRKIFSNLLSKSGESGRDKREVERNLESSMQVNYLYGSSSLNPQDAKYHKYEPVAINTTPNDGCGAHNPLFQKSDVSVGSPLEERESADAPEYSCPSDDSRYVSAVANNDEAVQQSPVQLTEQVSADVKKNVTDSNTSTAAGAPYNRLNHGANTTQAQPRLAKVEGLGYDALDN